MIRIIRSTRPRGLCEAVLVADGTFVLAILEATYSITSGSDEVDPATVRVWVAAWEDRAALLRVPFRVQPEVLALTMEVQT